VEPPVGAGLAREQPRNALGRGQGLLLQPCLLAETMTKAEAHDSLFTKGSGLHPVPPIMVGVWLLCRLLTSDRSLPRLPPTAQSGRVTDRYLEGSHRSAASRCAVANLTSNLRWLVVSPLYFTMSVRVFRCASLPHGKSQLRQRAFTFVALLQASSRPLRADWPLPFASSYRL